MWQNSSSVRIGGPAGGDECDIDTRSAQATVTRMGRDLFAGSGRRWPLGRGPKATPRGGAQIRSGNGHLRDIVLGDETGCFGLF